MKLKIFDVQGKSAGEVELPQQFNEEINPNLIKRAVHALQSSSRQPYGAYKLAGKRASVDVSKRRRDYKGCYGKGISRSPRKITSRRGERINWIGAFTPNARKGRRAHPPKIEKVWAQKINKKENRKAIRSALTAVVNKDVVANRGHRVPELYPFVLSNDFEKLDKTKNVILAFTKIGLDNEIKRTSKKKIRSGKGKMRGRKYVVKKGPLLVVENDCKLLKSARNITGLNIVKVEQLNAELLAPGTDIGRLTFFTKGAIEKIGKLNMFM